MPQATEVFLSEVIQRNAYLHRLGSQESLSIGGRPALKTVYGGAGRQGRQELVCVYTTLSSAKQLFFIITVIPEAEAEVYRDAFNKLIDSVRFTN